MMRARVVQISLRRERIILVMAAVVGACWLVMTQWLNGQEAGTADPDRSRLHEPIYRISKQAPPLVNGLAATAGAAAGAAAVIIDDPRADAPRSDNSSQDELTQHPLDPALVIARDALAHIESTVHDYTCTLVKRERVQGELLEHEFISCKIRHARQVNGEVIPFGVYLGFRKPESMKGREVIFVEGQNDGKIVAHEGGLKGRFLPTVDLMPTSALALRGNRYPITEIGILTLTHRLIEKGERDRRNGDCQVRMVDGAKVKDRVCTMLEVLHPEERSHYDFHLARVFLDNELKLPIRYEAYGWPVNGGKPPLLEEYTYMDVKLNVGLTDEDFSRENTKYRF